MMNIVKLASIIISAYLLSGCGTLLARAGAADLGSSKKTSHAPVYPATVYDVALFSTPYFPIFLLDLPISIVTDTLMLPVDLYRMN